MVVLLSSGSAAEEDTCSSLVLLLITVEPPVVDVADGTSLDGIIMMIIYYYLYSDTLSAADAETSKSQSMLVCNVMNKYNNNATQNKVGSILHILGTRSSF